MRNALLGQRVWSWGASNDWSMRNANPWASGLEWGGLVGGRVKRSRRWKSCAGSGHPPSTNASYLSQGLQSDGGGGEVIGEGDIGSRAEVDTHGRAPDKFLYSFTRRCSNKKKFKFITRTRTRTCNAQTHARAHINTRTRTGARIYTA